MLKCLGLVIYNGLGLDHRGQDLEGWGRGLEIVTLITSLVMPNFSKKQMVCYYCSTAAKHVVHPQQTTQSEWAWFNISLDMCHAGDRESFYSTYSYIMLETSLSRQPAKHKKLILTHRNQLQLRKYANHKN